MSDRHTFFPILNVQAAHPMPVVPDPELDVISRMIPWGDLADPQQDGNIRLARDGDDYIRTFTGAMEVYWTRTGLLWVDAEAIVNVLRSKEFLAEFYDHLDVGQGLILDGSPYHGPLSVELKGQQLQARVGAIFAYWENLAGAEADGAKMVLDDLLARLFSSAVIVNISTEINRRIHESREEHNKHMSMPAHIRQSIEQAALRQFMESVAQRAEAEAGAEPDWKPRHDFAPATMSFYRPAFSEPEEGESRD